MGRVLSGLGVCSVFRRGVRACVLRGQGGGAVRGFDDRRRAADEEMAGRSTCVIGSVGECCVANGWPWRAGGITCRAATTWSGRG